jgi:hypothetical protein
MNPGKAISVYFPHQSWDKHRADYTTDIRGDYEVLDVGQWDTVPGGQGLAGHVWRFDIAKSFSERGVADDVLLEFAGLETVPPWAGVYLIDRRLGRVVDLWDRRTYSIRLGEKTTVSEENARFLLLVGSEEFIDGNQDRFPELPCRTILHQNYPNPFNASTIIRYDLAYGSNISMRVYDAAGALVSVLYEGHREPGCYEAVWLGENESGRRVAAGLYFCRLETSTGIKQTRKLLLLK